MAGSATRAKVRSSWRVVRGKAKDCEKQIRDWQSDFCMPVPAFRFPELFMPVQSLCAQ
jgi:hypothetical protein